MGRPAASRRATDRGAGVVDGSAGGVLCTGQGPSGAPSLGPGRAGPVLPAAPPAAEAGPPEEPAVAQELTLHQLWFQLPALERHRFGHCFSAMLLKALGLRPATTRKVKS